MLNRIIHILKTNKDINDWKIIQTKTEANELFLIKKQIDMPRAKQINNIAVEVYKDFEEAGKKYRGSSIVSIPPTMSDTEISAAINEASFSASFIKNQPYDIPNSSDKEISTVSSRFDSAPLIEWMPKLKAALYKYDSYDKGYINSSELFLNKNITAIISSKGVHYSYVSYKGQIEFITSWKEGKEEIELYKNLTFADYVPEDLAGAAQEMLEMSRERAAAIPTPSLKSINVILHGDPVAELLKHYYLQADAQYVYQHISTAVLNQSIQGDNIKGDKINLTLEPILYNSSASAPVDEDGVALSSHMIIDKGVLKKYWGTKQYCQYLEVEPTGRIRNLVFEGGSKKIEDMRSIQHLEIASFSDFTINAMTADFAGEIRLGWYYDGNKRIAVSGGSISGNLNEMQTNMHFSEELQQCSAKEGFHSLTYKGPKALMLYNVAVAGN